ncbi:MAG TPA: phosphoenolpyruvate--protein phosphotransferase [Bacteriovoracaceae bacterium]|nr:phosphoenolpyruvate--protein phosphotransferase [Bacteriovoracaceae bacterium]
MLVGKNASQGIAIGRALVMRPQSINIETGHVSDVEREKVRFQNALNKSADEIRKLHEKVLSTLGSDKAQIFEAHLMILEDPELTDAITEKITTDKVKATKAVDDVAKGFIAMFEAMDQEYMRERALDIKDVTERILRNLLGIQVPDLSLLTMSVILVAHDITPSQMASIDLKCVLGIITEVGGKTSHTAIMARTLELPAVVGLRDATSSIHDSEYLIVDGEAGEVYPNPNADTIRIFEAKRERAIKAKQELMGLVGHPSKTQDGHEVFLEANIASAMDLDTVLRNDAQGVGLFRTEFIYMDRTTSPSEDEQFEIYRKVLERMAGKPTVIRTLDVGGDKNVSYLKIPKEDNPFLGFRAVRYCLRNPELFKTQLRALLRASIYGNLHIMYPMISSLHEVKECKRYLEEARSEVKARGLHVSETIKTGIMIEIPSAAVIADILAKHVDFFSIGTNDLIQYVCAVDRMNENVHDLYDPFHPAVLRLINQVIHEGHKAGIEVGMCGEMASNELLTEVLLGMGLTHFSMAPSGILRTRKKISNSSFSKAQKLAREVLKLGSSEEIKSFLA